MKQIIQLVLALLMPLLSLAEEGFVIKGKVTGIKSGYVSIRDFNNWSPDHAPYPERVRIVNGEFTYAGKLDHPRMVYLKVSTVETQIYLENTAYEVNCSLDSLTGAKVLGGNLNQQYWAFNSRKHTDILAEVKALIKSDLGPYLALLYTRDRVDVEAMYPMLTEAGKNTFEGKKYKTVYDGFRNSVAGKPFPALKLIEPDGKPFTEKDMAGKVVVFDFWASWCGPCIAYIPQLREYYRKFKGQDVLFVSISVDNTDDLWRKAMAEHPMEWTQVLSEGGFAQGEAKKKLSVPSIPYVVVVDKQGNIAATLDFYQKKDLGQVVLKALQ